MGLGFRLILNPMRTDPDLKKMAHEASLHAQSTQELINAICRFVGMLPMTTTMKGELLRAYYHLGPGRVNTATSLTGLF